MRPILLINLKTYEAGTGDNALSISRIAEKCSKRSGAEIIVSPQSSDLLRISGQVGLPVFSQHVDPIVFGSSTGSVLPEAVKAAGASGTLINHSEKKVDNKTIEKTIARCREVGLRTVVCADTPQRVLEIARLKPDYIAIEPPELIGGEVSVSKAKPEIITKSVDMSKSVSDVPVLCGAGVKNGEDVAKAKELGAKGILVASGVVKADNPEEAIEDLLSGFG